MTVSPALLGTALSFQAVVKAESEISDSMVESLKIDHHVAYTKVDEGFSLATCSTLAAGLNELEQIKGFLSQLAGLTK